MYGDHSVYKHLKDIPVQFQDILVIDFCCIVFCGQGNDSNILFKKKKTKKLILCDVNKIEKKFKQQYKEKNSNFIIALATHSGFARMSFVV